jgi:hypothetical protein
MKESRNNSEPLYLPQYRQVNYLHMLNEIISNEFIDDRLTKFLNILNGTCDSPNKPQDQSLSSQLSPVVPADKNGGVSPAS